MAFEKLLSDMYSLNNNNSYTQKDISLYPVGEYNLDGIIVLIENCKRMASDNTNVQWATVSPSLWLGSFLDKHWDKISYVCAVPIFNTFKIVGDEFISTKYKVSDTIDFNSEKDLDDFFENNKWRRLVLFYINKVVNLKTMDITYKLRYADITEKFEERDNKINNILDNGTNN